MTLAVTLKTQTLNVRFYIVTKISVSTVWPSVCRQETILDQLCTNLTWRLFNGAFYDKLSWRKKNRYTASLSTTNPTWNGLGSNSGIHHKSSLTNSPDHGAATLTTSRFFSSSYLNYLSLFLRQSLWNINGFHKILACPLMQNFVRIDPSLNMLWYCLFVRLNE
jgi:hypothetical protein